MKARIRIGNNTKGHKAILEQQGYEVAIVKEDDYEYYEIECTGFHEQLIDTVSQEGRKEILQLISQKKLFTYRTPFRVADDGVLKIKSSLFAFPFLGALTAFIARPVRKKSKAEKSKATMELENFLGL